MIRGISYLNLTLLTQAAKPVGETGGGMRNEIFGTLILVALGSIIALPIGLLAGVYLAEYANPKVAATFVSRADILAGVPSIVVGVFVYAIMVIPMHSYSAISGGVALAIIMVPVVARTAEESLRLVPASMREAALALGITRWRAVVGVVNTGGDDGDYHRNNAGGCTYRRGNSPAAVYGTREFLWRTGNAETDRIVIAG